MLPPHSGAACFKYQHNTYNTLAKALHNKGYNSHTLLGGNGSFWNQGIMTETLGYDELIDINQFINNENYDFGLTDSTFLEQSVKKMSKFKSPFLAQLITLSSHDPYVLLNNRIYLKTPKDCPPEMARYLNAIHYVDKCLGMFIDSLRRNGLFEKSILIISGDHDGTKQQPEQWKTYAKNLWNCGISQTPLIIVNGTKKQVYNSIAGQIDVYPTLLDILNLKTYSWYGLGQSLLSKNKPAFALNARFDEFGDTTKVSANAILYARTAWDISDLMIRKNYFKEK
jgi:phosphoglycerol transferase MdoB-like AlkP superfamily enzyme